MVKRPMNAENTGLPMRSFMFTLDQVSTMLEVDLDVMKRTHIFYFGRSIGERPLDKIMARNIAEAGSRPEWRVAEQELTRWLRRKGFRIYQQGWNLG